jgi:hypothetical protein
MEHACPTTQADGEVCTDEIVLGLTTTKELEVTEVDPSVRTSV